MSDVTNHPAWASREDAEPDDWPTAPDAEHPAIAAVDHYAANPNADNLVALGREVQKLIDERDEALAAMNAETADIVLDAAVLRRRVARLTPTPKEREAMARLAHPRVTSHIADRQIVRRYLDRISEDTGNDR